MIFKDSGVSFEEGTRSSTSAFHFLHISNFQISQTCTSSCFMANTQVRGRRSALIPMDSSTLSVEEIADIQRRTCATPAPTEGVEQPSLRNPFSPTTDTSCEDRAQSHDGGQEINFKVFCENGVEGHPDVNNKASDKKLWPAFRRQRLKRDGRGVQLLHQTRSLLKNNRLNTPVSADARLAEDTPHPSGPLWPYYNLCFQCLGIHP